MEAGKGYLPNVYHIMLEILQLFSRAEPDGELRSHFHICPANTNPASQKQVAIGRRQRSQNSTAKVRRRSRLRRRPWGNIREPCEEEAGYPKNGFKSDVGER